MKKRKSIHKFLAFLLSISMVPALTPLHNVEAATTNVFIENFEGYAVGRVSITGNNAKAYDSAGKQITGVTATVVGDDYFEIVQENGNKYLKLYTKRNSSSTRTRIRFNYGATYSTGVKEFSYKFKSIVHNAAFQRMGNIYTDETNSASTPIYRIMSQGSNIIYKIQNPIFGWTSDLLSTNYANGFATITQTVNYDSDANNYTLTLKHDNATRTKTETIADITTKGVKGICWDFSSADSGGSNGGEAGAGDYAVYAFDDIKVDSIGMYVTQSNVSNDQIISASDTVEITLDDAVADDVLQHISIKKDGAGASVSDYSINISNDRKKITISGFDHNSLYELKIDKNLKSTSQKLMTDDYNLKFKTKSIISHEITKSKYELGYVPEVTPLNNINYTYYISKDDGDYVAYNLEALSEEGKYSLKIVAADASEKEQIEIVSFEVIGAVAPEIKDIGITYQGVLDIDTELVGWYTYFDENDVSDENMDYCTFQWYRSDEKDVGYAEITGANSDKYTLTAADENKYIRFGVKPVSKVDPKPGKERLSEPLMSFMTPEVTAISIKGKMATYENLEIDYHYSDLNGDVEITEGDNATVVIWYTSSTEDGQYSEVGRGRIYQIQERDSDKWIKTVVIPKNAGGGSQDKQFESLPVVGAFAPTAQDVKITGNFNVGSTLGVDYRYYDANKDTENGTIIEWYVDGRKVSEKTYYTIYENDAGKSIYVSVTPKTNVEPAMGAPVTTTPKTASENTNTVRPSGDSSNSSAGNNNVVIPPKNENTTPVNKGFGDVTGHWAEESILKMVEKGIIKGKADGEFAPEDRITRAEFATLISRMLNLSAGEYSFNDVKKENWYNESVAAIAAAGYMTGHDGDFRPQDNITREEMAAVIFAIASDKGIGNDSSEVSFADNDSISDWAKNAVNVVANLGIIKGMDDNKFEPKGDATRAQTVVMLTRLQDVLGQ